jgi:hypothetical protein
MPGGHKPGAKTLSIMTISILDSLATLSKNDTAQLHSAYASSVIMTSAIMMSSAIYIAMLSAFMPNVSIWNVQGPMSYSFLRP